MHPRNKKPRYGFMNRILYEFKPIYVSLFGVWVAKFSSMSNTKVGAWSGGLLMLAGVLMFFFRYQSRTRPAKRPRVK